MDLKVDLEQELAKLRKIKELLEAEPGELTAETVMSPGRAKVPVAETFEPAASGPAEPAPAPEPEASAARETSVEADDSGAPLNLPEINQVMEQTLAREGEAEEAAGAAEESAPLPEEATWAEEKENFQALFEVLERYRKIEPKNGNGEISYFCKDERDHPGRRAHDRLDRRSPSRRPSASTPKLTQTESPKEQFFIKQEIINFQEVLRKYVLRNVKLCEREGAVLPQFTADILNLDLLKEILEKLSMENWSNPAEFSGFQTMIESLKDAYYAKITPPALYLKSLIRELGA